MRGEVPLRFGVLRPARLIDDLDRWTGLVEDIGADLVGFGEAQTLFHDPHVVMTLTAKASTRLRFGPVVSVPVTRHPTVAANAMSTLQLLSDGRAYYGIGPGDFALYEIGETGVKLAEWAEYALAVRGLCAGEEVEFRGKALQLRWSAGPVPLWMAGDGPKALQLAGRIADGVIVGNAATPELVTWARGHIEAGAREAGRSVDDIEVWYFVRMHLAESEAQGRDDLGFYMARYPRMRFRRSMHDKGVEITPGIEEALAHYGEEYSSWEAYQPGSTYNYELLERVGLKDWVARQFLITGPVDHVVAQLRTLVAAGARNIMVPQMLDDLMATTADVGTIVDAVR